MKMRAIVCFVIQFATATIVWGQRAPQAFPIRLPDKEARPVAPPLMPKSVTMPIVFATRANLKELGAVRPHEIETANRAALGRELKRSGLVRTLGDTPLSLHAPPWTRHNLPDGRLMWALAVNSSGASGLRIQFSRFDVGDGFMTVYGKSASGIVVRGPYTRTGPGKRGEFWSESIPGDTAFIEVIADRDPTAEVAAVVHFDQHQATAEAIGASESLSCQLDVMCEDSPSIIATVRDAVGQMNFIEGGNSYVCSGVLLNDLDDDTFVPYFLTAYHCLHTQSAVNTLEVVWFWQRNQCGGSLPDYDNLPRNCGGELLETNPTDGGNDMSFIRLDGVLPAGVAFAGWTTASLPETSFGIHHPAGRYKRITFFEEDFLTSCGSFDPTDYHAHLKARRGITEGGSSGSPLFNSSGQVLGQLYGKCFGPGTDPDCSNRDDWRDVYGEFETTYDFIQNELEIGGTIHVDHVFRGCMGGTPSCPWITVGLANSQAWNGARMKIKAGDYDEAVTFTKQMTVLASGGSVTIGR